jgi:hypothetical protein
VFLELLFEPGQKVTPVQNAGQVVGHGHLLEERPCLPELLPQPLHKIKDDQQKEDCCGQGDPHKGHSRENPS